MSNGIESYVSARMKRLILAGAEPEWIKNHKRRSYIVTAYLSSPLWMTRSMLREQRRICELVTAITGEPHVLDHLVPLSHPYVCGLTVPWNIQVIPKRINDHKSNRWAPDQISLELVVYADHDHEEKPRACLAASA